MLKGISSFGDQAIICDFGEEVNQGVNGEVIALFKIPKEMALLYKRNPRYPSLNLN